MLARADGLRFDRDGVMLCTAPLHHNAPYMFSLMALLQGHHVLIEKRFDAQRTLDLVERMRVTWLYVVPTMMSRILRLPDPGAADLSSLRTVLHVGAPCPPDVKRGGWISRDPTSSSSCTPAPSPRPGRSSTAASGSRTRARSGGSRAAR